MIFNAVEEIGSNLKDSEQGALYIKLKIPEVLKREKFSW